MARTLSPSEQQERKQRILAALGQGLSLVKALKEGDITAVTLYKWKDADPIFASAVDATMSKRPERAPSRQPVARKAADIPVEELPDVVEEVCKAIRAGLPIDYACLLANVQRGTLRQWMIDDLTIAERVNKAQAQNLLWWISKIRAGAERDWKAALAYLERIFPALFAEVRAVDINVRAEDKAAGMIDVTPDHVAKRLASMSDDELEAIIARESK